MSPLLPCWSFTKPLPSWSAQFSHIPLVLVDEVVEVWSQGHIQDPPPGAGACKQILWDYTTPRATAEALLKSAHSGVDRAHLLTVSTKESGTWLHVLQITALGMRIDDEFVRIAVSAPPGHSNLWAAPL